MEDNASPHTARATRKVMNYLKQPIVLVAPGSYISLAHEGGFRWLKNRVNYKLDEEGGYKYRYRWSKSKTFNERFCARVNDSVMEMTPELLKGIEYGKSAYLRQFLYSLRV